MTCKTVEIIIFLVAIDTYKSDGIYLEEMDRHKKKTFNNNVFTILCYMYDV